jgi:hypothetical protein
MISLGDEEITISDTIINYAQVNDCPIPHIQQVNNIKYNFMHKLKEHICWCMRICLGL